MSDKSIKLNRDLDKMLAQAIERDLLVRIGWGREGDEKPKNTEVMKELASMWKSLNDEERDEWNTKAQQLKDEYN